MPHLLCTGPRPHAYASSLYSNHDEEVVVPCIHHLSLGAASCMDTSRACVPKFTFSTQILTIFPKIFRPISPSLQSSYTDMTYSNFLGGGLGTCGGALHSGAVAPESTRCRCRRLHSAALPVRHAAVCKVKNDAYSAYSACPSRQI